MQKNLLSSVVVFLVALPLCMGIAIASGVPPALGLITGIIGGIAVGALAGSPLQVSGPAAGLAVMVYEIVRDQGISMLGPIVLAAGLLQLAAGLFGVGQWFRAMSPAVIYGMLAGIGILIVGSQFHVMLDAKPNASGLENLAAIPKAVLEAMGESRDSQGIAALLGIAVIATLLLWQKFRPEKLKAIPGALIAVVLAAAAAKVFALPVKLVSVPSNLLSGMSFPGVAEFSRLLEPAVMLTVVAVAFIASAETLLSAAAVDKMHTGPRTNYNRELVSQGVGNMLCGAVGALPMTGVIVRSAANVNAGATSRASSMFHGLWLLLFVVFFGKILQTVPTCALAGILVYTGFKLVHVEHIRKLGEYGKLPVAIYAATVVGIVATDLLTGVMFGLGLAFIKLIYKLTHLRIDVFQNTVAANGESRRIEMELRGAATFLAIPRLAKALDALPAATDLHVQVMKLSYIDHACMELLADWEKQNAQRGSRLHLKWEDLVHRYYRKDILEAAA